MTLAGLWVSSAAAARVFPEAVQAWRLPCTGAPLPDARVEGFVRGLDDAAFERAVVLCAVCRLDDCGGLNVLLEKGPDAFRLVRPDF